MGIEIKKICDAIKPYIRELSAKEILHYLPIEIPDENIEIKSMLSYTERMELIKETIYKIFENDTYLNLHAGKFHIYNIDLFIKYEIVKHHTNIKLPDDLKDKDNINDVDKLLNHENLFDVILHYIDENYYKSLVKDIYDIINRTYLKDE